jgi:chemotaxis protein histidine kinase CheA
MSDLKGTRRTLLAEVQGVLDLTSETLEGCTPQSTSESLARYADLVGRLRELTGADEYMGLQDVCVLYQECLIRLDQRGTGLTQKEREQLYSWPALVRGYLESPTSEAAGALVTHLEGISSGTPLSQEDAETLRMLLGLSMQTQSSVSAGDDLRLGDEIDDAPGEDESLMPASRGDIQGIRSCADDEPSERLSGVGSPLGARDTQCNLASIASPTMPIEDHLPGAIARDTSTSCGLPSSGTDRQGRPQLDSTSSPKEIPTTARELVELLSKELPLLTASQTRALELGLSAATDVDERQQAFDIYAEHLGRFGEAAGAVGFAGLHQVCAHVQENVLALGAKRRMVRAEEANALEQWGPCVRHYLDSPYHSSACCTLLDTLCDEGWVRPLAHDAAETLLTLLQAPELTRDEEGPPQTRPQKASADDISLEIPEDVNAELLEAMLHELPKQAQELCDAIQNLARGGTLDDVKIAQRVAHTVKGASNTVGVRGLAVLTHHLEDILLALAKYEKLPSRAMAASMLNAVDCLESMCEALTGAGDPPDDTQAVLQEVLNWANEIDRVGLMEAENLEVVTACNAMIGEQPAEAPDLGTRENTVAEDKGSSSAKVTIPMVRVPAALVDDLLRLAGETLILTGQVHERVRMTVRQTHRTQEQFARLRQLGAELERFIDITDLNPDRNKAAHNPNFDPLEMDQYSELHTHSRMLVEAATDAGVLGKEVVDNLFHLDDMLVAQERLNRETQDLLMSARMVPARTLGPRLQRVVRQTCRLTGKQANLYLSGGETLLDSDVLNQLVDPLMHMLSNAVDHGIELPKERARANKDVVGTVRLDFAKEGNNVVVRCSDDGAGLDLEVIRRRAEEMGLLISDSEISDEELKRLILRPNFSTRSQVTQTSGRGIGMDVVYSRIQNLRGSLAMQSRPGEGCVVEVQLPLTMITTHALLVRVDSHLVAIGDRGMEQILHGGDGELRRFGDQWIFQVGEEAYPVKSIRTVLGLTEDLDSAPENRCPVLLLRDEIGVNAVFVDQVLESRDLVVKKLGTYVPKLAGIMGVTILGDGAVVAVLDLPELLQIAHRDRLLQLANTDRTSIPTRHSPLALVVDDSLSARRALEQVMEDSGYDVSAARDGMEAVELIQEMPPDIILADLEMPRMNGIELVTHIRAQEKSADLPVIMISSRSTKKHREQALAAGVNVYLTKPFSEDELLDHVQSLRP